jgi:hypothetical protein
MVDFSFLVFVHVCNFLTGVMITLTTLEFITQNVGHFFSFLALCKDQGLIISQWKQSSSIKQINTFKVYSSFDIMEDRFMVVRTGEYSGDGFALVALKKSPNLALRRTKSAREDAQ